MALYTHTLHSPPASPLSEEFINVFITSYEINFSTTNNGFCSMKKYTTFPPHLMPVSLLLPCIKYISRWNFLLGEIFTMLDWRNQLRPCIDYTQVLASRGGLDICARNDLLKIDCLIFAFDKFWKRNKQPESRRGSSLSYIGNVVAGGTKNPSHPSHCCIILINLFWSLWLK